MRPSFQASTERPTPQPTSPWTEVFQQQAAVSAARRAANRREDQRAHAMRPAEADAVAPTQDALSVIFNHG